MQFRRFSALQRAEIAEISPITSRLYDLPSRFSALQRAEIAEMRQIGVGNAFRLVSFSALQRAEIAEMLIFRIVFGKPKLVSVLFNEPKLLKFFSSDQIRIDPPTRFSALQRAEIAEIQAPHRSSDSR